MINKLLKLILFLIVTLVFNNLSAQKNAPELSFGILYADIKTAITYYDEGNTWRRGAWVSLNQNFHLHKWFNVDVGLTYQERMPLEVLPFKWGLQEELGNTNAQYIFEKWPTNPQNELFDSNIYVRIPNFEYLNIEIIPNIKFGNTLSFTIGAGLFGGVLLNRENTTVTREDIPVAEPVFGPPNNVYGEVIYHKYDCGWIPKATVAYELNHKIKIGLQFKSYHSFIRLNDSFVDERDLGWNMRWIAHAGGLSVQYKF